MSAYTLPYGKNIDAIKKSAHNKICGCAEFWKDTMLLGFLNASLLLPFLAFELRQANNKLLTVASHYCTDMRTVLIFIQITALL